MFVPKKLASADSASSGVLSFFSESTLLSMRISD
jgi:hypothetical protein